MNDSPAGFREIEHTADWELEVWAPNLPQLLEQAARGMYALARVELHPGPLVQRQIELPYMDPESLLVTFLSELLYLASTENLAFDHFDLELQADRLLAHLAGSEIASLQKEIKAVTYHNLTIRRTESGLNTRIVFDV